MDSKKIISELKKNSNYRDKIGMARFGINPEYALGVRVPVLRSLAKKIGKDHKLALDLWSTKIHEARILATMIDESEKVTSEQMENWVKDFNSWDLCDQCLMNLFDKTPFAFKKAVKWAERDEEFIRRSGFALMACLAWHNKDTKDKEFLKFFPIIKRYSIDERNFVRKAVNWAIRQIGKRNSDLNKKAIKLSEEIKKINSKSAKWISSDALRELKGKVFPNQ
ncbi:MAG: DNA alkylation repair protein [Candidatus Pacebacteria bacterium]|nr:DNA alkylation repair protein [Candidatus Paceibacterota bacterium]